MDKPAQRSFPRKTSYRASAGQIFKRDFPILRHLAPFLTHAVATYVRAGAKVLDFGCGEQPLRKQVESLEGVYTSMDIAQNSAGTVDFVGRLETYMPRIPQFDVILCSEVLEHTENPAEIVRILASLLREEGVMIVSTPFLHGLHEEPYDFSRLTVHFFSNAAAQNGLEIVSGQKLGSTLECAATAFGFFLYSIAPRNRVWRPFRTLLNGAANLAALLLGLIPAFRTNPLLYLSNAFVLRKPGRPPSGSQPRMQPR